MERVAPRPGLFVDPAAISGHPAVLVWRALSGAAPPDRVQVLKEKRKAAAYRLLWDRNGTRPIVAKRRQPAAGAVERSLIEDVLPAAGIPALGHFGSTVSDGSLWVFSEDAAGEPYNETSDDHVRSAALWLAALHVRGAAAGRGTLPVRDAGYFRDLLLQSIAVIEATLTNPLLTADDVEELENVIAICRRLDGEWTRIERAALEGPVTVIHGDFTSKNLRVRDGALLTFDWEMAGWGPAAIDLAHFANIGRRDGLSQYFDAALELWTPETLEAVERAAVLGGLFRSIASLNWTTAHLKGRRARRYAGYAAKFGKEIRVRGREVLEGEMQIVRSRFPDGELLLRGLSGLLGAPAGEIEVTHREPNLFRSSFPSEVVFCRAAGRELKLLCKYGVGHNESGFGHRGGVEYETAVYRQVLDALPISRPAFHGEWTDPVTGEPWLAIEYVEHALRTDAAEPEPDPLTIIGRWLGQFHRWCSERLESEGYAFLKRYDRAYYTSWAARTSEFAGHWHDRLSWLRPLCERFDICADVLLAAEPTAIHAEFTPHNVLVRKGVVYPVDWEAAAVGAGEIDIAALTDKWPQRMVDNCIEAYSQERWDGARPDGFDRLLTAARLYWALRWLGNKPEWTQREKSLRRFEQVRALGEELGLI